MNYSLDYKFFTMMTSSS